MLKYLSVDREVIAANRQRPASQQQPALCIEFEDERRPLYGWAIDIPGYSRLVYCPDHEEASGPNAKAWIEVKGEVILLLDREQKYAEVVE